jgi:hypothetical protein
MIMLETSGPIEMNGYSIIGAVILNHSSQLIIGESYKGDGDDFRKVFVVATAPHPDECPTYWHNGTYFDGYNSRDNERAARADFASELLSFWGVEFKRA